ncbi:putative Methyltransferase domain-containing protein [Septoria linicola]|nr:putative Methyltransferase domain-containing protein [Septoria linicola]
MSAATGDDAWMASGSDIMRDAMQSRRITPNVLHLLPILDALPPSAVVCEVGCGPGGITLDIAQRYPHLTVLGIDIDTKSIEQAQDAATKADVTNLSYAAGDAVKLNEVASLPGFEALNSGCDLVYSHAAIMHTSDQVESMRQMRLAAKPGGTVSLKEGDSGLFFAYPDIPGMKKMLEVFPRLGAAKGADTCLGRKLLSHALAVGYTRDEVTLTDITAVTASAPVARAGLAKGIGDIFANVGNKPASMEATGVSAEDITFIRQGLEEWSNCPDGICSFPSLAIICVGKGITDKEA